MTTSVSVPPPFVEEVLGATENPAAAQTSPASVERSPEPPPAVPPEPPPVFPPEPPFFPPDPAAPPVLLSEVLAAFTDAAFRATEAVRSQHLADLQELYEDSPDPGSEALVPRTVQLGVTPFVLPAEGPPPPIDVPLAALVQPNPLIVDEMAFDFECNVVNFRAAAAEAPTSGEDVPRSGTFVPQQATSR